MLEKFLHPSQASPAGSPTLRPASAPTKRVTPTTKGASPPPAVGIGLDAPVVSRPPALALPVPVPSVRVASKLSARSHPSPKRSAVASPASHKYRPTSPSDGGGSSARGSDDGDVDPSSDWSDSWSPAAVDVSVAPSADASDGSDVHADSMAAAPARRPFVPVSHVLVPAPQLFHVLLTAAAASRAALPSTPTPAVLSAPVAATLTQTLQDQLWARARLAMVHGIGVEGVRDADVDAPVGPRAAAKIRAPAVWGRVAGAATGSSAGVDAASAVGANAGWPHLPGGSHLAPEWARLPVAAGRALAAVPASIIATHAEKCLALAFPAAGGEHDLLHIQLKARGHVSKPFK